MDGSSEDIVESMGRRESTENSPRMFSMAGWLGEDTRLDGADSCVLQGSAAM
jgi:hypothetical protein